MKKPASKVSQTNPKILQLLKEKSCVKQEVFRDGKDRFSKLKKIAEDVAENLDEQFCEIDENVKISFTDEGQFEFKLQFSGDVLLFQQHSNVFTFEKDHQVWKTGYVREDKSRAYFTLINVYNFLVDSIRFNREKDVGVLLFRIFINREGHFFIEGKKQLAFLYNNLPQQKMNAGTWKELIDTAIIYSLEYDLTVPKYKNVMLVSVKQLAELSKELMQTGKETEFGFYSRMQNG